MIFKEMTDQQITAFLRSTRPKAEDAPTLKLSVMRKDALDEPDRRSMIKHNLNNGRD